MAKRSDSKAAKIRALLKERPDAKAMEIVQALAAQKVKVSPAQVYMVKSASGKTTGRRGRPATSNNGKPTGIDALIQAKKLSDSMGGIDKARAAMAVLAKLV